MSIQRRYLKILVSGPYASGKTTFIKTLCEKVLTTEAKVYSTYESQVKSTTTVAFDYGKMFYNRLPIYLFGTPGQIRFNFMWKILSLGIHGYIFIIDGSSLSYVLRGRALYEYMKSLGDFPHIIAVNKQDIPGSVDPSIVARLFNINPEHVIPLIALEKKSAFRAIERIVDILAKERKVKMIGQTANA